MSHRDLIHLRCSRMRGRQSRAALVWRVGEGRQRSSLVRSVELRAHVGTTPGLVGRPEAGTR